MHYFIERASQLTSKERPCEEAFLTKYIYKDIRLCKDQNMIYDSNGLSWFDRGINHRIEDDCIVRDIEKEDWVININSLEDLQVFIAKYACDLIVNNVSITIYDDYID